MPNARPRLLLLAVPLLAPAACAGPTAPRPVLAVPMVAASELPPIPVCRNEMRAYVEITKLAKLHGGGWTVFQPAIDAMKQQIGDCVGDIFPAFQQL